MNLGSGVIEHGAELRLSTGAALFNGWCKEEREREIRDVVEDPN